MLLYDIAEVHFIDFFTFKTVNILLLIFTEKASRHITDVTKKSCKSYVNL